MMTLKERQRDILGEVIREYIRTARPVASKEITDSFGSKISPATIRHEMLELDHLGFLEQPHTSAGRIPTDKGYRFFVDYLMPSISLKKKEQKTIADAFTKKIIEDFIRNFTRSISELSGTFAIGGVLEEDLVAKTGLSRILGEPEFEDQEIIKVFGKLVDRLDEEIYSLAGNLQNEEKIFIGEENPVESNSCLAMMISTWDHPAGFRGFMAMIGPKRMDYQRNISLLRYLKNNFN